MRPTKCDSCSWPTLGERCIPCRIRAGEEVPGHRFIVTESATIPTAETATIIACSRSGVEGEVQQLPLGAETEAEVVPIEE